MRPIGRWIILGSLIFRALPSAAEPGSRYTYEPTLPSITAAPGAPGDQRGTKQAPVFVQIIPAPRSEAEVAQEANAQTEREATDRWTMGVAVATAVILLLQLGVFGWQGLQLARP
jgi:hypothetical protein